VYLWASVVLFELRNRDEAIVSADQDKIRRQSKVHPKTRLEIRLAEMNRQALEELAEQRGTSMSKVVNDWLQELRAQSST
jgi:hypothetical protein